MTIDKLRAATIGAKKNFKSETIEYNGVKFEIRQPSIRARAELTKQCTGSNGAIDMFKFLVWLVIELTYVPNTDKKVFTAEDYDTLVEQATGGFVDAFSEVAASLVNVDMEDKKKTSPPIPKTN
mgnify:CR=1 FL=1